MRTFIYAVCAFVFSQLHVISAAAIIVARGPVIAPATGATYLVDEGAEGTGKPGTWAADGGSPNWDDSTTFIVGSQSVELNGSASDETIQTPTFAATTFVYFFCRAYFTSIPSTARAIIQFRNGTTTHSAIQVTSTGQLSISGGGGSTVSTMNTGTWYYIWGSYNAATGATEAAFSSTSTEPTSGNNYVTYTATGTTDIVNIRMLSDFVGTAGPQLNLDHILVDDADIGNDP